MNYSISLNQTQSDLQKHSGQQKGDKIQNTDLYYMKLLRSKENIKTNSLAFKKINSQMTAQAMKESDIEIRQLLRRLNSKPRERRLDNISKVEDALTEQNNSEDELDNIQSRLELKNDQYARIQNLNIKNPEVDYDYLNEKKEPNSISFKQNDTHFDVKIAKNNLEKLLVMLEACNKDITPYLGGNQPYVDIMLTKAPGCMTKLAYAITIIDNLRKWSRNIIYSYIITNQNLLKVPLVNHRFKTSKNINQDKLTLTFGEFIKAIKDSNGNHFSFEEYRLLYQNRVDYLIQFFDSVYLESYHNLVYMVKMCSLYNSEAILCNFYSYMRDFITFKAELQNFEEDQNRVESNFVTKRNEAKNFDQNIEVSIGNMMKVPKIIGTRDVNRIKNNNAKETKSLILQ